MAQLIHGGDLAAATAQYGQHDWLDLSTGINPHGWPIPSIDAVHWQRLPSDPQPLLQAARDYYQTESLLAVAGSQAAIRSLAQLRPHCRVGCVQPSFNEHAASWRRHGHQVSEFAADQMFDQLDQLDVLILCQPNNPTGRLWSPEQLLQAQQQLSSRQGWLILDEAFIDTRPELSLSPISPLPGLIVLRSLGKFFGLAGARVGFVLAEPALLGQLAEHLGPWTVSGPSQAIARLALLDSAWQQYTRQHLAQQGQRLQQLLKQHRLPVSGGCELFQWLCHPQAQVWHQQLAQHGIWSRYFQQPCSLRLGLAQSEPDWQRLQQGLSLLVT